MPYKRKPDENIEIVLPVASFLDMAFQILAFFIFTYHPNSLEGQMEMALPAGGEARAQTQEQADPTKPPEKDVDLKTEVTVTVTTPKNNESGLKGEISQVLVEGAEGVPTAIYQKSEEVKNDSDLNLLINTLKRMQKGLSNKDSIKIRADSGVKYLFVVKVMDACYKAGFKNIGFAAPPDFVGVPN
jgi:biopolymer transport protein ExbD